MLYIISLFFFAPLRAYCQANNDTIHHYPVYSKLPGQNKKQLGNKSQYLTYDQLYDSVAANKPGLTKEQFAADMRDPQKRGKLFFNAISAGDTRIPQDYDSFVKYYGFNKPLDKETQQKPDNFKKIDGEYVINKPLINRIFSEMQSRINPKRSFIDWREDFKKDPESAKKFYNKFIKYQTEGWSNPLGEFSDADEFVDDIYEKRDSPSINPVQSDSNTIKRSNNLYSLPYYTPTTNNNLIGWNNILLVLVILFISSLFIFPNKMQYVISSIFKRIGRFLGSVVFKSKNLIKVTVSLILGLLIDLALFVALDIVLDKYDYAFYIGWFLWYSLYIIIIKILFRRKTIGESIIGLFNKKSSLSLKRFTLTHKIIIASVLGLFIITNPSPSDFKTYLEAHGSSTKGGREYNFLILSIYREVYGNHSYVGVLMNFYPL